MGCVGCHSLRPSGVQARVHTQHDDHTIIGHNFTPFFLCMKKTAPEYFQLMDQFPCSGMMIPAGRNNAVLYNIKCKNSRRKACPGDKCLFYKPSCKDLQRCCSPFGAERNAAPQNWAATMPKGEHGRWKRFYGFPDAGVAASSRVMRRKLPCAERNVSVYAF